MSPDPPTLTAATTVRPADEEAAGPERVPGFRVSLEQFEGPFDLLLTLIARRRLDVTELALAEVTDEFLAHMRADWDLGHASEFLVVAATLLALKAHRLLPHDGEEDDDEDLELLEARDLLFARLLQYRAYKQAAAHLRERAERTQRSHPRVVGLAPELAALLPRLVSTLGAEDLARVAAEVLSRPAEDGVQTVHLHESVPVGEQVGLIALRLRRQSRLTFTQITADAGRTAVVVARFLALLILYRQGSVELDQDQPMDEITVTWCGAEDDLTGIMSPDVEEEFA
ncbi:MULTISPECIES: ScpA family protein [unclassified Actinomyces]|uniref:segregation and condensation protein A n=1 Tax=unclassified Actinomyces TaxID=2609248 RepID=UPI0020172E8B|nr:MULTISPECIES: ScpA family protein [unclassified Actinomyces]MCL3777486.1 segregation/condensation protein A [Actinomyces sp. AC-20-1]MCL3788926.1 segregation/condensation protein A [Actinomyces sp. 187325]MCL3791562.1 segregation/condensation protein A [Actinomyces sp. 186855]MCL3794095.1 segregation/condensation protein A [Actinomyces sp. 217892]